jgi:hypothetical protein
VIDELSETVTIDNGRWTLTETLCGGPDRGMFRASGDVPALVTIGAPQQRPHAELARKFAYVIAGVTPFFTIQPVTIEGIRYDALVEAEPVGAPITVKRPADGRAVARGLVEIVARAHAVAQVLGGIRPELVYAEGATCTGIAPRAEPFLAGASARSYGVPPCFDEVYLSPEAISLEAITPASDVFSLCATLVYLLEGEPPFPGESLMERITAAMHGRPRPTAVAPAIIAGLAADPRKRPDVTAILAALA